MADGEKHDHPSFDHELGPRIDVVCRRIGSRSDAARAAGVTTAQLQRIMNRSSSPSLAVITNLAKESGASIEWIASGAIQNKVDTILDRDMVERMLKALKTGVYGKTDVAYKVFISLSNVGYELEHDLNLRLRELETDYNHLTWQEPEKIEDAAHEHRGGESDPKLQRRLFAAFQEAYRDLGISVSVLDLVELVAEEHNRIRRHAAAGNALDAVIGYAVDQLRQRLLQANDEAASRKRPA